MPEKKYGGNLMRILLLTLIIFTALFINIFPNYYAYINTPKNYSFSGQASWFDPWDINVYVSAIKFGQQGNLLLENLYTSLPNKPIFMYPLYTLSGFFTRSINPFLVFHLLSLAIGLLFSIIVWFLLKKFLSKEYKLAAFFLIIFGGGLGWIFYPNLNSADLYITGFTFISQFQRAHEALGVSLYLISLVCFYLFTFSKKARFNIFSLISIIILIVFYPYYIFSYFLICGIFSILKYLRNNDKTSIEFLLLNLIISTPILFIYYNHIQSNQTFSSVLNQRLSTPNIIEILSGYGVLFLLVLIQLKSKKTFPGKLFLNIWFFISIFMSFLPLGFSRFYLRGLFFPLIILSIYGLIYIASNSTKRIKLFIWLLIFIVPVSSFFIFFKRIAEVNNKNPWYYIAGDSINVLQQIPVGIPYSQSILSYYQLGNYIPAGINLRVYFGHLIQTSKHYEKVQNLVNFYGNKYDDVEAQNFLKENNIKYVYYGEEEKNLSIKFSGIEKLEYKFLKLLNSFGKVEVFGI